jgi:hypothetical protein
MLPPRKLRRIVETREPGFTPVLASEGFGALQN